MYCLSLSSAPSIRTWDQLNGQTLAGKAQIAKLNELTVSEVTELTSSKVDETALAILKRQGSRGILIVCSQRKITFTIQVCTILTELTDKTL
jgi:hypothetical protein